MNDDLDSRIFFTLKNHVVLQCVLKYLDVVGKIQFLTFLKLNRGWSYKDNIITVGENWDLVFLLLCFFFSTPKQTLKQNKPFQKMWIFAQIVAFPLNLFQANGPAIYFWQNSKQWDVKSEVEWGLGARPCRARPLSCWSPSPSVPARTPPTTQLSRTCSSTTTSCSTTPRRWRVQRTQGIQVIQKMNPSPASSTMTSRIRSRYWWGPVTT